MIPRLLSVIFYTALGVIMLAFMAMNRETVSVRILPFFERFELPLFAALAVMFIIGLLMGLSFAALQSIKHGHHSRRQARAIAQLEKELAGKSAVE